MAFSILLISFLSSIHHKLFGCNLTQVANNLRLEQLIRSCPALLPRVASICQLDLIIDHQRRCLLAAQERETALSLVLLFNVRKAEEALAAVERHMDNFADQEEVADSEETYHGILFEIMGHANDLPRLEEEVDMARTIIIAFENSAADPLTPKVDEEAYEAQKTKIWESLF